MNRRHWRIATRLVAAGALAGCTAITGASDLYVANDEPAVPAPERDAASAAEASASDGPDADSGTVLDAEAGASSPCPSFAIFCDGFESGDLSKWTSLFETNGGTVTTVTAPAFGGSRSLRARGGPSTPVNGSYPNVGAGARIAIPVVSSGVLAVRSRIFMPAALAPETTFIKTFGANGTDDMNFKIAAGGAVKIDADTPGAGAELVATAAAPLGRWFCLEWRATIGTSGRQVVVLDGETILDAAENNATSGGYDVVQIGFNASDGSRTQEVFADDVVIARQPIGCL